MAKSYTPPLPKTAPLDAIKAAHQQVKLMRAMIAQRPGGPHIMSTAALVGLATSIEIILRQYEQLRSDA